MADEPTTPIEPLPDPYPEGTPEAPRTPSAPPVPTMVKDPAVRLEPPPDPGTAFLGGRGASGQVGGPNELMLAGMGKIMDQQARILEMLREGAKF